MGFADDKKNILEALSTGIFSHEARDAKALKNLLACDPNFTKEEALQQSTLVCQMLHRSPNRMGSIHILSPCGGTMKIFLPGETLSAICPDCGRQEATFRYDSFEMKDGVIVKDVLQAFCNRCGTSVLLPHQSTARIKQTRSSSEQKSTSVRLPLVLWDIAASLVLEAGGAPGAKSPEQVLLAFISAWIRTPRRRKNWIEQLRQAATSPVLEQPVTRKATLLVNQAMYKEFSAILRASELPSMSDVLRSCLLLSLDEPTVKKELEHILIMARPASSGPRSPRQKKAVA